MADIRKPPKLEEEVLARFDQAKKIDLKQDNLPEPQKVTAYRVRAMLYLAALGQSPRQIAYQLNCSDARVRQVLKSQSAQKEIERIQSELFLAQPQKMFNKILPGAVRTAERIMKDKTQKGSTRADVAFKFMDRALGKPKQEIEHSGSPVRQLFDQLDLLQKRQAEMAAKTPTQVWRESSESVVEAEVVAKKEEKLDPNQDEVDRLMDELGQEESAGE